MKNENEMMQNVQRLINELEAVHDRIKEKDTDDITKEEADLYIDLLAGFYSDAMVIPIDNILKTASKQDDCNAEIDKELGNKILKKALSKTIAALIDRRNNLEGYYFNNESIYIE